MAPQRQRARKGAGTAGKAARGVIYARVSSKEQEEGYSIDAQFKLLREYCAAKGIEVVSEFVEAETAKAAGRREFARMLRLVSELALDAIVVEKTDRLYRNLRDRVTVDDLGVALHLVRENEVISKDSRSHARFVHDIKLVVAKNYVDNLSEETKKGMTEKARQGIWPTKAPLGYLNVERAGRRVIELDPERAELVRRLFLAYAEGLSSLKNLARLASDLGLRTRKGRRLARSHVATLLQNSAYCGLVEWAGETHAGKHEPLVDVATFRRVQDLMHGRSRNNAGFGSKSFAYRGLMSCGHCGCALTAELKKGRYVYYHCTGNHGACPKPFVREERLTEFFASLLDGMSIPSQALEWISGELRRERGDEAALRELREKSLRQSESRLLKRLEALYVDKADGEIPLEVYRSLKEKAERELAEVRVSIESKEPHARQGGIDPESLLELAHSAPDRFNNADSDGKRELLSYVCSNCTYTEGGVQVSLRKPFDILLDTRQKAAQRGGDEAKSEEWLPD